MNYVKSTFYFLDLWYPNFYYMQFPSMLFLKYIGLLLFSHLQTKDATNLHFKKKKMLQIFTINRVRFTGHSIVLWIIIYCSREFNNNTKWYPFSISLFVGHPCAQQKAKSKSSKLIVIISSCFLSHEWQHSCIIHVWNRGVPNDAQPHVMDYP